MDPLHAHAYSFPGFGFLLTQLTYRFVPYGDTLLTFVLLFFLLSGGAQLLYQICRRQIWSDPQRQTLA